MYFLFNFLKNFLQSNSLLLCPQKPWLPCSGLIFGWTFPMTHMSFSSMLLSGNNNKTHKSSMLSWPVTNYDGSRWLLMQGFWRLIRSSICIMSPEVCTLYAQEQKNQLFSTKEVSRYVFASLAGYSVYGRLDSLDSSNNKQLILHFEKCLFIRFLLVDLSIPVLFHSSSQPCISRRVWDSSWCRHWPLGNRSWVCSRILPGWATI